VHTALIDQRLHATRIHFHIVRKHYRPPGSSIHEFVGNQYGPRCVVNLHSVMIDSTRHGNCQVPTHSSTTAEKQQHSIQKSVATRTATDGAVLEAVNEAAAIQRRHTLVLHHMWRKHCSVLTCLKRVMDPLTSMRRRRVSRGSVAAHTPAAAPIPIHMGTIACACLWGSSLCR
jgi:hypothetical protein